MKTLKNIYLYILSAIIIFILDIISFFKKIRFSMLDFHNIGHTIFETDQYLIEKKILNNNQYLDLFGFKKPICNSFLIKKYKKLFYVNNFFGYIYYILSKSKINKAKKYIYKLNYWQLRDTNYNGIPINKNQLNFLKFNNEEILKEKICLNYFNLTPNEYVCIHVRDSSYNDKFHPHYKTINDDSFRSADADNIIPSILFLIEQGLKVVRMGKVAYKKINIDNDNFIDYPFHEKNSDENDIFILKNCKFFIGMLSGITLVPLLFNKPVLWINSYFRGVQHTENVYDLIVPRKMWFKNEKRFLTLDEMRKFGGTITNSVESFTKHGIDFLENTKEEILNSVKEMYLKLNNQWIKSLDFLSLEKKYLELLWNDYKDFNVNIFPSISESYLLNNKFLLNINNKKIVPFQNYCFYNKNQLINFKNSNDYNYIGSGFKIQTKNSRARCIDLEDIKFQFKIHSLNSAKVYFKIKIHYISDKYHFLNLKKIKTKIIFNQKFCYLFDLKLGINEYLFNIPKEYTINYQYINIRLNFDSIKFKSLFLYFNKIFIYQLGFYEHSKKLNKKIINNFSLINPIDGSISEICCTKFH